MAALIRIIGVGEHNAELAPDSPNAVSWWVRDRRGRTRGYDSLEAAKDAAATFRSVGGVLLDEVVAAAAKPEDKDAARAEMHAFEREIVADLMLDERTDLERAYPRDAEEIAALGHVPNRYVVSGVDGLDVYVIAPVGEPILTIPRGLAPHIALMLIEAWRAGCEHGFEWGIERAQAAVGSLPTRPGA